MNRFTRVIGSFIVATGAFDLAIDNPESSSELGDVLVLSHLKGIRSASVFGMTRWAWNFSRKEVRSYHQLEMEPSGSEQNHRRGRSSKLEEKTRQFRKSSSPHTDIRWTKCRRCAAGSEAPSYKVNLGTLNFSGKEYFLISLEKGDAPVSTASKALYWSRAISAVSISGG
ncbi:hypothetical protein MRB53_033320 [Persea americana]|uniref:Uncharacterized protein n=1 Tax=Persea americana TaxID=3435 RepID=A0ACC2KUP7_PERAE|nr:hypothetical protein MRB53_033320 [Persea americana]